MRSLATLFLFFFFVACVVSASALPQGGAVRLEGQVVCCAECWAEADRTKVEYGTAEDLLKAQTCVANGDPTLIAVREGAKFNLYRLEPGKFTPPGAVWLQFVGQRVAVNGTVVRKKGKDNGGGAVRVDALEVLAQSTAEREAASVVGWEVGLSLPDLSGAAQSLSALKGRVVVLNFWATYCAPCRAEMPDLAALQNEYAALGVQVVGASTDAGADRAKVSQFVKEVKVNFPVWTGATAADMSRFGLGGALPGTVILGRDGRVAHVIRGVVKPAELRQQIDALLAVGSSAPGDSKAVASATKTKAAEASTVPS